jgi:hypothetical protein
MDKKRQGITFSIFAAIIAISILAAIFAPKAGAPQSGSTLDLNPSPSAAPTSAVEDVPSSWENYNNDEYSFTLDYPKDWYKQNYISDSKNGLFLAFSPEPLPCETCSYLHDGYFSIKIYNQKTNPEAYAAYLQRTQSIGKIAGYQPVQLSNRKGVLFENTIAVENEGWIFELLFDKDGGTAKMLDSEIFKKVYSSFRFTNLQFNY